MLFTACGENNVHKEIAHYLDEAYLAEEEFIEYQEELLQLEERDLEIYDEIVQLNDNETDKLEQLFTEVFQLTEQREVYLQAERDAISQSKEDFLLIEPYIDQVKDEEERGLVEELYEVMTERYKVYDDVYEAYLISLELTEGLYEHLESDQSETLLHNMLEDVNESYEELFKVNDQFNRLTKQYNRYKKEYYELVWE